MFSFCKVFAVVCWCYFVVLDDTFAGRISAQKLLCYLIHPPLLDINKNFLGNGYFDFCAVLNSGFAQLMKHLALVARAVDGA